MGRGEGRSDDNPETIRKRFKVYQEATMPVIRQYEGLGKLRQVMADQTPEEVFVHVSAIIDELDGVLCAPAVPRAVPPRCKVALAMTC
jgi:UMP-CMP kinase